jgi:hypothetical protein
MLEEHPFPNPAWAFFKANPQEAQEQNTPTLGGCNPERWTYCSGRPALAFQAQLLG